MGIIKAKNILVGNVTKPSQQNRTSGTTRSNKLLKLTSELKKNVPEYLHIFVDCMDSQNDVKKACFGFTLEQNYKEKIEELEDLWNILHDNFGVTIPNKCHVIFSHVPQLKKTTRRIFRTNCRECTAEVASDLAMVY